MLCAVFLRQALYQYLVGAYVLLSGYLQRSGVSGEISAVCVCAAAGIVHGDVSGAAADL